MPCRRFLINPEVSQSGLWQWVWPNFDESIHGFKSVCSLFNSCALVGLNVQDILGLRDLSLTSLGASNHADRC